MTDEFVATEAARAINDDFSIEAALPDLGKCFKGAEISKRSFYPKGDQRESSSWQK